MIKVFSGDVAYPLNVDDYHIVEKYSGLHELSFTIPVKNEAYRYIAEESPVWDDELNFLVKAIDEGDDDAEILCQIDLDGLKTSLVTEYSNDSDTIYNTIRKTLPSGWTVVDQSGSTIRRTIELESATPLEIIEACRDVYDVTYRFDSRARKITILKPDYSETTGAFMIDSLNLTELNYSGKSSGLVTRLYARGADGLTFASINGGRDYVEDFTYTDKIICSYWSDDRYTDAESLLADAKAKLREAAIPTRSYSCNVIDLAKTNPEMYGFLDFSLYKVVTLIDRNKRQRLEHMIVEYTRYPNYPEKNIVTLSATAPKIQNTVKALQTQINGQNEEIRSNYQAMQKTIEHSTALICGGLGGNVIIGTDAEGKPNEILIMNTADKATAVNVLRINQNGIGFSKSGYNGPFETAWTLDGSFVASYIVSGTLDAGKVVIENLTADRISSGRLQGTSNPRIYFDLDTGEITSSKLINPTDTTTSVNIVFDTFPLGFDGSTFLDGCMLKFLYKNQTTGGLITGKPRGANIGLGTMCLGLKAGTNGYVGFNQYGGVELAPLMEYAESDALDCNITVNPDGISMAGTVNTLDAVSMAGTLDVWSYATFHGGTNVSSSRTIKQDIAPISTLALSPLDIVMRTQVYRYTLKKDLEKRINYGFIAEEAPDEITTPQKKEIGLMNALAMAYGAIQELKQEIDELRRELCDQSKRNATCQPTK